MTSIEKSVQAGSHFNVTESVIDRISSIYESREFLDKLEGTPGSPASPTSNDDGFVMVEKQDAVEAMAYYIASFVQQMPEAQTMEPKQLQMALQTTFKALRRRRLQHLLHIGRNAYRYAAVSYTAYRLYEHPWMARAIVAAIWTGMKMACGMFV